ncbi:MAG: VWA domain-containing protein [Planctomycetes bacterium]|nr:VWA domain-containing protein [Planctomycetota bacterium]
MAGVRCENCGNSLNLKSLAEISFKCPLCGARLLVPADCAGRLEGEVGGRPKDALPDGNNKEAGRSRREDANILGILACGMPWVLSIFMHAGVFLLAMFVVFIVASARPKPVEIPDVKPCLGPQASEGVMTPGNGGDIRVKPAAPVHGKIKGYYIRPGRLAAESNGFDGRDDLIGTKESGSAGSGQAEEFGLQSGGGGVGPQKILPETIFTLTGGGSASGPRWGGCTLGGCGSYQVIYVIDRSGSMACSFDFLRREMLRAIGMMKDAQDFHVIFYSDGEPIENPPKQLVAASRANKIMAAEFLKGIAPYGPTDPLAALNRAFDVLQNKKKGGKLIYFLSDGLFPDSSEVMNLIAQRNPQGANQVMICTFLYGSRDKNAEAVMQKIAIENRGRYKYVDPEE